MQINDGTNFTVDELGFIQTADAKILAAVARGELDLNVVARRELVSRGLDPNGKWVGFDEARRTAEQLPIRGSNGKKVYVTVPEDER